MHAHVSATLADLAGRLPGDNLLQHRELQLVACSHGSRLVLPVYLIATQMLPSQDEMTGLCQIM